MAKDITPFTGGSAPVRFEPDRGLYEQPHWVTREGQVDRRLEAEHRLDTRSVYRAVEMTRLTEGARIATSTAQIEAALKIATEKKYAMHRAERESIALGETEQLRRAMAELDNDLFDDIRRIGRRGDS